MIRPEEMFRPGVCAEEVVMLTHTRGYLDKLVHQGLSAREQRVIGFPQSEALTRRELVITQGTIDCCRYAMTNGVSLNVAGGTHHAFADRGEGFCLLNDFAVAANYLLHEGEASRILIVDLDVHQGNGTASIFANEPRVFTFSMHGRHNYPFHKERSGLDVALEDGLEDEGYLALLREHLPGLLDRVKPEVVFFLSGVDILATDQFGKLRVTPEGCRRRDEFVFSQLHARGIPCVVAMGGGYSKDIRIIVEAHCATFRVAREIFID
ncbi:histone deacetylase family protein [Puia sp. P3]|uniref:histone deacetylase family protein n=1 Tax=Puia sp. P3 TaxID=3423952 RepID=UPI003D66A2E3